MVSYLMLCSALSEREEELASELILSDPFEIRAEPRKTIAKLNGSKPRHLLLPDQTTQTDLIP